MSADSVAVYHFSRYHRQYGTLSALYPGPLPRSSPLPQHLEGLWEMSQEYNFVCHRIYCVLVHTLHIVFHHPNCCHQRSSIVRCSSWYGGQRVNRKSMGLRRAITPDPARRVQWAGEFKIGIKRYRGKRSTYIRSMRYHHLSDVQCYSLIYHTHPSIQ